MGHRRGVGPAAAALEQASEPDVVAGPFIELLLRVRQELRGNGQYAEADRIRDAMIGLGVTVNDKADGSAWSLQRTDRPSS